MWDKQEEVMEEEKLLKMDWQRRQWRKDNLNLVIFHCVCTRIISLFSPFFKPIRITLFTFFLFVFLFMFAHFLAWLHNVSHRNVYITALRFSYLWLYSNMVSWIYLQHAVLFPPFFARLFFLFFISISYHNLFFSFFFFTALCSVVFFTEFFFFGHTKNLFSSFLNFQDTFAQELLYLEQQQTEQVLHGYIQGICFCLSFIEHTLNNF